MCTCSSDHRGVPEAILWVPVGAISAAFRGPSLMVSRGLPTTLFTVILLLVLLTCSSFSL
eukprot:5315797-Pyramimonas_sp.AAC.1